MRFDNWTDLASRHVPLRLGELAVHAFENFGLAARSLSLRTANLFPCHAAADEEYEKLRERRRNCQPSRMYGQLMINLSSLTIVHMPAILIVLHMIISGSPTQSAAYRSHHLTSLYDGSQADGVII